MQIFKPEGERISMEELKKHRYVRLDKMSPKEELHPVVSAKNEKRRNESESNERKSAQERTLAVEKALIPVVQTKKAFDLSQKLHSTVGVQNMCALRTAIEQTIEETRLAVQSLGGNSYYKEERISDENGKQQHDQCVNELKELLQVVKNTLENVGTI
ncbi:hypothetical protein RFI_11322 [Reticulomyxa filosa]|uniref:Uncharacterized protein n=1 Tax=Reticulomyxa filosa TaxID=46433 RepID=X6NKC3_RETFI|nr:hypothetical protein RFI_11322 [Reticulomyxa filosa]|eukprot:ETO25812.1 hypothetical protein RFI_11322 [Reticulomyxa filosa]